MQASSLQIIVEYFHHHLHLPLVPLEWYNSCITCSTESGISCPALLKCPSFVVQTIIASTSCLFKTKAIMHSMHYALIPPLPKLAFVQSPSLMGPLLGASTFFPKEIEYLKWLSLKICTQEATEKFEAASTDHENLKTI